MGLFIIVCARYYEAMKRKIMIDRVKIIRMTRIASLYQVNGKSRESELVKKGVSERDRQIDR